MSGQPDIRPVSLVEASDPEAIKKLREAIAQVADKEGLRAWALLLVLPDGATGNAYYTGSGGEHYRDLIAETVDLQHRLYNTAKGVPSDAT